MTKGTREGEPPRLKVAAAQFEPRPGDVRWNISQAIDLAAVAGARGADLVVLPELVTTGYYMFDRFEELAEPVDGPTVTIIAELARRWDLLVVLGLAERGVDGRVYDTAVLVGPDGRIGAYRKVHLWDKERAAFAPGDDSPVLDVEGTIGRLGVLVCYDLEFPETAELVTTGGARLLAVPAAIGNCTLWKGTLESRARDLGVPIVAANRLGLELDTRFCGHSMVMDADGKVLADAGDHPGLAMAEVELTLLGDGARRGHDSRFIHPEFG
jgi:predicted amidohydrolase